MDEFDLTHNAFNLGAVRQALMWENCPLPVPDRYKIGSYFTAADSVKLEEMVLTFEDTDDDIPTFERNKFTVHHGPTLIPTHVALYVNHDPDQRSESKMRVRQLCAAHWQRSRSGAGNGCTRRRQRVARQCVPPLEIDRLATKKDNHIRHAVVSNFYCLLPIAIAIVRKRLSALAVAVVVIVVLL